MAQKDVTQIVPAVPKTALTRAQAAREQRLTRLAEAEDEVYERSLGTVRESLFWADYDPATGAYPKEWDELPEAERKRRIRIATAAWLPASHAPVGLKLAVDVTAGVQKARAGGTAAQGTPRQLNVQINLPAPTSKNFGGGGEDMEVVDVE